MLRSSAVKLYFHSTMNGEPKIKFLCRFPPAVKVIIFKPAITTWWSSSVSTAPSDNLHLVVALAREFSESLYKKL